jgi:hypothetical protein
MRSTLIVLSVLLAAGSIGSAAQSGQTTSLPYAGKWQLNVAKSDFGETTLTFENRSSGEMQLTTSGQSYTFRLDGKDYPALYGRTAAWTRIDANTWQTVNKQGSQTVVTEKTTISPDGKTLTVVAIGPKPAGGKFEQTIVYERVSGERGLAGKWKTKNVKTSAPTVLEIAASGADGLRISVPDFQMAVEMKFDGKDYPVTGGPAVPPGMTMSIQKQDPRAFTLTEKQNGKPIFSMTLTVSEDGKTLTEEGAPVGVAEKFRAVYDRTKN